MIGTYRFYNRLPSRHSRYTLIVVTPERRRWKYNRHFTRHARRGK